MFSAHGQKDRDSVALMHARAVPGRRFVSTGVDGWILEVVEMIKYSELGMDKRLNEIVMAGSHDAGIASGAANAKTQSLDIFLQATAGVRLFDLRIAARTVSSGGVLGKEAQMKAYHAGGPLQKKESKSRYLGDLGRQQDIVRSKLVMDMGEWGMGLTRMLGDAKKFVETNREEFLILKFDKCTNWLQIAETCIRFLGNAIYCGSGNVNTRTLRELAGSVIVVFSDSALQQQVRGTYSAAMGILGIRKVPAEGAYDPKYNGIQYHGKGGTSPYNFLTDKIKQNIGKQSKLMKQGGDGNPDVMGMMYWTTTGLTESIYKRNEKMWSEPKVAKLRQLWSRALPLDRVAAREQRRPGEPQPPAVLEGLRPNFVMIDFADAGNAGRSMT